MEYSIIIPAGGSNARYNTNQSKLLELINGVSILEHSINCFLKHPLIHKIIIPCNKKWASQFEVIASNHQKVVLTNGGNTRAESVKNGVNITPHSSSHIMIHDAARPNLSLDLINRLIEANKKHPVVIPGIQVTDTIKEIKDKTVIKTVPRDHLIHVQTPQCFEKELLMKAYANITNLSQFTDESSIIETLNSPIHVIDGCKTNIKITYPEDLSYLKLIM